VSDCLPSCPQCRSPGKLELLDPRYAAELGGLTSTYLLCQKCRTISREVRPVERLLGTAVLIPMFIVSIACGAVGSYLWVMLHLHGKVAAGFLLTSFTLLNGAAFAVAVIFRKLKLLHVGPRIIPIGELREI
jgi:hypothetical protein